MAPWQGSGDADVDGSQTGGAQQLAEKPFSRTQMDFEMLQAGEKRSCLPEGQVSAMGEGAEIDREGTDALAVFKEVHLLF